MADKYGRRWYKDSYGLKGWVVAVLAVAAIFALMGAGIGFTMYSNASGCEQKQTSRPDLRMEWHWNTGCIITNPDQSVVISQ